MQIHELTRQTPGTSSNLIFDTGSATYRALVSDVAATIIEQYAGSTIAGSAQTLQTAINALNANKHDLLNAGELASTDNLNSVTTPGTYTATGAVATAMANSPITVAFRMLVEKNGGPSGTRVRQTVYKGDSTEVYFRLTTDGGSTWSAWEKSVPIRNLYIQNATTNKKIRVKQTNKTRGSMLIHGVDNSGNPRLLSLVWDNNMTTVTATDVIGTGGFGTPTISNTAYTVDITVPNYFCGIAIPTANNAAMTIDLISA